MRTALTPEKLNQMSVDELVELFVKLFEDFKNETMLNYNLYDAQTCSAKVAQKEEGKLNASIL